jgi:hypothetical protein
MPAWRVDGQGREINEYDVGAGDVSASGPVLHVVLCTESQPLVVYSTRQNVSIVHMRPPLEAIDATIDIIATASLDAGNLNSPERRKIKTFIDERLLERKAQEARQKKSGRLTLNSNAYRIHPCSTPPDTNFPFWRYSCVGFVVAAYREALIELVDESSVPQANMQLVKQMYPDYATHLDVPRIREHLGIGQGDEWPIVFAGYLVNSLARSAREVRDSPYQPSDGDRFFPPVRTA